MKHITTEDALRALEEAVAEKGEDYIYDTTNACRYVEFDSSGNPVPSCIAGNALHRLGVPLDDLRRYNIGYGVTILSGKLDIPIDDGARNALDCAQQWQDQAAPWGSALEKARGAVTFDA